MSKKIVYILLTICMNLEDLLNFYQKREIAAQFIKFVWEVLEIVTMKTGKVLLNDRKGHKSCNSYETERDGYKTMAFCQQP